MARAAEKSSTRIGEIVAAVKAVGWPVDVRACCLGRKLDHVWIAARCFFPLQKEAADLSGAARWHRGDRDYTYTSQPLTLVTKRVTDKNLLHSPRNQKRQKNFVYARMRLPG